MLGADGAYSAVRAAAIQHGMDLHQDFLRYGYKELTIPARDGEFALDPGALHIWPRGASMMIALPNPDRSFTCTLFWAKAGLRRARHARAGARGSSASATPTPSPLMPTLAADYLAQPGGLAGHRAVRAVGAGPGRRCVGDAAHAIVPFFGQGANCAFEDCVELDRSLTATGGDWPTALARYQDAAQAQRRRHRRHGAGQLRRDERQGRLPGVPRARRSCAHALERALGGRYVSRYELVSFTTIPYAEIEGRIRRQDRTVGAVAAGMLAAVGAGALLLRRRR